VCLTAVLLVSSLTPGRGLLALYKEDMGYKTSGIETATISLAGSTYETPAREREYLNHSLKALQSIPGVKKFGAIDYMPLVVNTFMAQFYEVQTKRDPEMALLLRMSPGLIDAMEGKFLAGRDFKETDRQGSEPVAIVNESFAKLNGGVREMLGRKLMSSVKEAPWSWRVAALAAVGLVAGISVWWKTRGVLRMTPAETLRAD